jgi:hypothetical protein
MTTSHWLPVAERVRSEYNIPRIRTTAELVVSCNMCSWISCCHAIEMGYVCTVFTTDKRGIETRLERAQRVSTGVTKKDPTPNPDAGLIGLVAFVHPSLAPGSPCVSHN